MKTFRLIFIATLFLAGFAGCQKENITVEDDNLLTEQETITDAILADLDALTDEALNRTLLKSAAAFEGDYLGTCPTITTDRTLRPRVMTLDFGTGCTGKDGKVRSGKIIITSESLENTSMKRVKTFDNFYVEGRKVEGSIEKTITLNREELSRVAVVNENITITFPDGKGSIMREAEMTREYLMNNIGNLRDDVITSKGTMVTTRLNGVKVTKAISDSDPLVFKVACHQFVSGIVTMTSSDGRNWSIDYGDGECDKKAVVTSGDRTKEITLR